MHSSHEPEHSGRSFHIQDAISELGPWFHNLHLPDGTQTAPHHQLGDFPSFKWNQIKGEIPDNLNGWQVLDIGCNAGFYCIELARRGATVTGIDVDPHYLDQARWAAGQFDLQDRITFKQMQIYDLGRSMKNTTLFSSLASSTIFATHFWDWILFLRRSSG